jgi:glycosyltransferase involved in cell wall biosynthesis
LVLIGEGEEAESLTSLARELGVHTDVEFLGFQHNPYKYMARADVFALPSLWEGFGRVLVEAMACGVPVIATRCPSGPEEIVCDGASGLLVPPGDADALADAVLRVLTRPDLAHRLAQAGRRRAEDFRAETAVALYQQLFLDVRALRRAAGQRVSTHG